MATYNAPSDKYMGSYNPDYFIGQDDKVLIEATQNVNSNDYVRRDGSNIMTGHLITPSITLYNNGMLQFSDDSMQNTAYTPQDRMDTNINLQKLTKQSYDGVNDITSILGALKIKKIIFMDDNNNEQTISFNVSDKNSITSSKDKTTNLTYDSGLNKTSISNNTYISNLTTGNFNTTHLSGTTSNVQTQLNTKASYTDIVSLSGVTSNVQTQLNTKASYIDIVSLSGVTSNVQTQLNTKLTHSDIVYLDGVTSNVQTQLNTMATDSRVSAIELRTQNLTSINGLTASTFNGDLFIKGKTYLDGEYIKFQDNSYQYSAFTETYRTKLNATTLINSSNKLDMSLISTGIVSNTEFNYLDGVTSNIQTQLTNNINPTTTYLNYVIQNNIIVGLPASITSAWRNGTYIWNSNIGVYDATVTAFYGSNLTLKVGHYTLTIEVNGGYYDTAYKLYSRILLYNTHFGSIYATRYQGLKGRSNMADSDVFYSISVNFQVLQPNVAYWALDTTYHFESSLQTPIHILEINLKRTF